PETILEGFGPEIVALVNQLRRLVLETLPDATEAGYPGWRAVAFRHPVAGYICGAFPSDEAVKFLFEQGVHLHDPAGILQGSTKQTRYVLLRPEQPVPEASVTALILEAVAYGEARRASRKSRNRE
ncbi:MAG TPA: DUF1801 domain-containing protein, partial [Dehalococcoidia bacterium]|nr:DUF1801 domain-containing protein [Dehalococcoidia bacterium]